MAYDRDKVFKECIEVIKKEKLSFFTDLAEFIEPDISTLYIWEFEKSEDIKKEIAKNRIASKRKLRNQWQFLESAPALQLAAYKLMADKEEIDALTMNRVDANISGTLNVNWQEERTYEADSKTNKGS